MFDSQNTQTLPVELVYELLCKQCHGFCLFVLAGFFYIVALFCIRILFLHIDIKSSLRTLAVFYMFIDIDFTVQYLCNNTI